ncbi:MAG: enoyl-CoA hydratase-related protein, partial [Bradyrhizobium sp.]|nr:enoyl-CoA hydratase-related protein [Bradyrhizobium sp.]
MSEVAKLDRHDIVGIVTIDSPPVNALSAAVRGGILDNVKAAIADPEIKVIVLTCGGRTFIAGADITEFVDNFKLPDEELLAGNLEANKIFSDFEDLNVPTVAAINGIALGGGLEMCLAADFRVMSATAKVGLPEVKLGLLPGAGGTQRLPRLAGVAKALAMIVSGAPIRAADALDNGIVDELFDGDLIDAGQAFAQRLLADGKGPRRTGERNERV